MPFLPRQTLVQGGAGKLAVLFAPPTRARHLDWPSTEVLSAGSTVGSKEAAFLRLNGLEREVKQKWANLKLNLAKNVDPLSHHWKYH